MTSHSSASTNAISQEQKEGLGFLPPSLSKAFSEAAEDPVIKLVSSLYGIKKRDQVTVGTKVSSQVNCRLSQGISQGGETVQPNTH